MANVATDGAGAGGGAADISISVDEISEIYNRIKKIILELEKLEKSTEAISSIKFYKDGKAKKALKVYDKANKKAMDLYDNYAQIAVLVKYTIESMMEQDELLSQEIRTKLNLPD
ncbi:hypothetical protein [Listeria booriae]|uniref:hypothetical protein n=1 Tax=Listeria booriae TaxID=1552123 RepID=UPI0016232B14|nr:hypothetical protein [Listeria booriae]MBC2103520.1 hypothetical protein [Listeria booriae]